MIRPEHRNRSPQRHRDTKHGGNPWSADGANGQFWIETSCLRVFVVINCGVPTVQAPPVPRPRQRQPIHPIALAVAAVPGAIG